MNYISTIISVLYLSRIANHITLRTSWQIAILILPPFLSSIFEQTFFSFLTEISFDHFSMFGPNRIFEVWFSGSSISLTLIGILFLAEKISLSSLGILALTEIWLLGIATMRSFNHLLIYPDSLIINTSIILALTIQSLRSRIKISNFIKNSLSNKVKLKFSFGGICKLLMAILFVLLTYDLKNGENTISIISASHVFRIFSFWSIFLALLILIKSFNFRILTGYLPALILYLGFALVSLINLNNTNYSNQLYQLNCLSSIALLPLLEYIFILYQGIKSRLMFKNIFTKSINVVLILRTTFIGIIFLYNLYIFTR